MLSKINKTEPKRCAKGSGALKRGCAKGARPLYYHYKISETDYMYVPVYRYTGMSNLTVRLSYKSSRADWVEEDK